MAIIVDPTEIEMTAEAERQFTISGGATRPGIPSGFDSALFSYLTSSFQFDNNARSIKRVQLNTPNQTVKGNYIISPNQGWGVEGVIGLAFASHESGFIGVVDDLNRFSGMSYVYVSSTSFRKYFIHSSGQIVRSDIDWTPGATFRVVSNGTRIEMYYKYTGVYQLIWAVNIRPEVINFRHYFEVNDLNTFITQIAINVDDGFVPFTWENVDYSLVPSDNADFRIISANKLGLTVHDNRNRNLEVNDELDIKGVIIPITVLPLYLRTIPNGLQYAIKGETIKFESNGGNGGALEASDGLISDALEWIAPDTVGVVNFTYTIGEQIALYQLQVVPKLEIANVENNRFQTILAQGETVQFESTVPGTVYQIAPNSERIGLTPDGLLIAPNDAKDERFGYKLVTIIASGAGQTVEFDVEVYPMFPTIEFCGARSVKWVQERPDYLPVIGKTVGGKREVHNQNENGTILWNVQYQKIPYNAATGGCCDCGKVGCDDALAGAKRLDDFYKLVKLKKRFTIIDKHTNQLFKGVELVAYSNDHNDYSTDQLRNLQMYYDGGELVLDDVQVGDNLSPTQYSTSYSRSEDADIQAALAALIAVDVTDVDIYESIINLILDLKDIGIWGFASGLWPMVGGTPEAHAINIVGGTDGTWNGSWTHSSDGALPNGVNAFFNTHINFQTLDANDFAMHYYSRTNIVSGASTFVMGSYNGTTQAPVAYIRRSGNLTDANMTGWTEGASYTDTDGRGDYLFSRTSDVLMELFKNGIMKSQRTIANTSDMPNLECYAGAINNVGTATHFSALQCAFLGLFNKGLTDVQALAYHEAIHKFQTSLGRAV